jgi:hypothetical protein
VTKAVNDPLKFVLAAMDFLRTRVSRPCRYWKPSFISGLVTRRKARPDSTFAASRFQM